MMINPSLISFKNEYYTFLILKYKIGKKYSKVYKELTT